VRYDRVLEKRLLRILAESRSEHGVLFSRWLEINSRKYDPEFLAGIEGTPDLTPEVVFHLEEMMSKGLVYELKGWGSNEGRQFRITKQGSDLLTSERGLTALLQRARRHWVVAMFLVVGAVVWFLFQNLEPRKTCGFLPQAISSWLERCTFSEN